MPTRSPASIGKARYLRRNMTLPERVLWFRFKAHRSGFQIRRQHRAAGYYLDFYVHEARLCIEVDGSVHGMHVERDEIRDNKLAAAGILTVRVSAKAVLQNANQVYAYLYAIMCERSDQNPNSLPPPEGEVPEGGWGRTRGTRSNNHPWGRHYCLPSKGSGISVATLRFQKGRTRRLWIRSETAMVVLMAFQSVWRCPCAKHFGTETSGPALEGWGKGKGALFQPKA